jgi:hypothetical protein
LLTRWTRRRQLEQLERLRDNAPDIEWTLPTGHRYTTESPPALGYGSTAPTTHSVMELELALMI